MNINLTEEMILALIICFPVGRTSGHPWGTRGNPRGMVQFWYFLFAAGEGSCLVLETTSLDHGDIPTGLLRVLVSGMLI